MLDSGAEDPERILTFSTPQNLAALRKAEEWAADGNFKTSPQKVRQDLHHPRVQLGVGGPACLRHSPEQDEEDLRAVLEGAEEKTT